MKASSPLSSMFEMPRDTSHFQLSLPGIDTVNGGKEFLCGIPFEGKDLPAVPVNEYLPVFGHSKREWLRFKFSAFVNFAHKYKKHFLLFSIEGIILKLGLSEVRLKLLFIFGTEVAPVVRLLRLKRRLNILSPIFIAGLILKTYKLDGSCIKPLDSGIKPLDPEVKPLNIEIKLGSFCEGCPAKFYTAACCISSYLQIIRF